MMHPHTRAWPRACAAVVLAAVAMAAPRPAPAQRLALPELHTWELDNGMKVAFMRVPAAPAVATHVWYHVGSKDEPPGRRGMAHMFEHMMFKGTERVRPEGHARHVNRVGGYSNARTSEDATWYINVVPRGYLDFACQLEAERMRKLLFRGDMIATEREVVKEEIRQQENNPITQGLLRLLSIAYTRHPYAWTAGGAIADLDATAPADLKAFYDTYYVPSNAMLVVVGDLSRDEVERAAAAHFGAIPRGAAPPRLADAAAEPAQTQPRREVVAPGHLGLMLVGYHVPAARHDDVPALQVAELLLGVGDSSRLHRRLVEKDRSAVQAGAPLLVREHPGMLLLYGVYIDPAQGNAVEAALFDEIATLERAPVPAKELRKAKNQLQAAFAFGLENVDGIAEQIGTSWILTGDPAHWLRTLDKVEAVTPADVQRVVRTYLKKALSTVVVVPPMGGAQN